MEDWHLASRGAAAPPPRIMVLLFERYERDSRVRRHVRALARAGYEVRIVAIGGADAVEAAAADGGRLRTIGRVKYRGGSRFAYVAAYTGFTLRALVEVARAVRGGLEAVLVNAPPDVLVFAAAPARLRGIPILLDVHDMTSELFEAKFGAGSRLVDIVRAVETAAYRFAAGILTVHAPYRDRIAARAGAKLVVDILNVPDQEQWYEIGRARAESLGKASGAEPHKRTWRLGHHGTIAERFGVDLAVRAVAELRSMGLPVTLAVLGDGDFAPELERLIDHLEMKEAIAFDRRTFTPDEIPAFVAKIDAGVAPYHESRFVDALLPVKVLEYLTLGVPVVATSTAVLRAYLPPDAVRYVSPATVETVRNAIRDVLEPARARAFASSGVRAMERLSWPAQQRRLLDTVTRLTGSPPVRPR